MAVYRTRDGDDLDFICWKHYGNHAGTAEAVLRANPGLAEKMTLSFAAGVLISLPDLPPPVRSKAIRLWD